MHDTVESLVAAGVIVPRKRTTADDLELAATWLENYEGDPDDARDVLITMASVARKLRREATARTDRRTTSA